MLLTVSLAVATEQTETNPVYAALLNKGVSVTDEKSVKLPPPILADGLDRDAQQAAIRNASDKYDYDQFVRDSTVAPFVYEYRPIDNSNPDFLVYGIDVCFVAYGELETLQDVDPKQLFNLNANAKDAKVVVLDDAALREHGITLAERANFTERFEHAAYPLFNKVQVEVTNQANLSATDQSLVRATRLDDRFAESPRFPNQWRPISITPTGGTALGEPHPFRGTGMYLKTTRLIEPTGALFVEYHTVSVEPDAWFNGKPLIRSKLLLLLQREVRKFRHTLASQ